MKQLVSGRGSGRDPGEEAAQDGRHRQGGAGEAARPCGERVANRSPLSDSLDLAHTASGAAFDERPMNRRCEPSVNGTRTTEGRSRGPRSSYGSCTSRPAGATPSGLVLSLRLVLFRPRAAWAAAAGAARLRGAAGAARRAGPLSPDAAARGAAARRRDAVASSLLLSAWKVDRKAVGAESRRSPHPVVRPALYVMSGARCRPLRCAATDSNRLRPAVAVPGAISDRVCSFRAAAALVHALRRLSAPTALTRRGRLPSSPPGARRRARGAHARARPPCDEARPRPRSAST